MVQDAGDGGGSAQTEAAVAVGAVVGGPAGAVMSLGANMAQFVGTAAAGGFEVSPEGGQAMIDTITAFQEWAASKTDKVDLISQVPMLGSSYAAREVAPFVQQVAIDGQGFRTQFQALLQSLEQAKEGIRKAMENYQRTEEANQAALRGSGGTMAV